MRPTKISKELSGAVAEEQKRQAIDAAKKKAVAQYADYDTFKKMVSVAHLKPIQAPGIPGAKGSSLPAWQLDPRELAPCSLHPSAVHSHVTQEGQHTERKAQPDPSTAAAGADALQACRMPQTSQEFVRDWRQHCTTPEAKYMLLQRCGADGLSRIFKVEVDGVTLGQMLQVMQQQWMQTARNSAAGKLHACTALQQQQQQQQQQQVVVVVVEDPAPVSEQPLTSTADRADTAAEGHAVISEAVSVVQMLKSLAGAGRFDLNVRLMDKASKAAASGLCSQLHAMLQQSAAQPKCAAGTTVQPEPDMAGIGIATATSSDVGPTSSSSSSSSSCASDSNSSVQPPRSQQGQQTPCPPGDGKECQDAAHGGQHCVALKELEQVMQKLRL